MKTATLRATAALPFIVLLSGCISGGDLPTVSCLPKGVYIGEAMGAEYTDAQKKTIDAMRMLNCPNAGELGYGPVTPEQQAPTTPEPQANGNRGLGNGDENASPQDNGRGNANADNPGRRR